MKLSPKQIVTGWPRDVLVAAAACVIASGLYVALGPAINSRTPLVPFVVAVMISGCVSTRAGILATVIAAAALATLLPPMGNPWVVDRVDRVVWAMFVVTACCLLPICAAMHRGRRRVQLQANALLDAEHSARRLNRRFQIALDAGRMIAWDWDLTGNAIVHSDSARELFGFRDEPHADFLAVVDPEDRPRVAAAIQTAIDEGSGFYCEYRARCADGTTRWFGARAQVVESAGGNRRLTGATVDITERVRLEDQLRDEDRQKDLFIATLAHELRNPLAPLSNGLEVLRRTLPMSEAIRSTQATMERQLAHMGRLVDDLLDVSRITHGKLALDRQRVALNQVLDTAIETVQPLLDRAQQKIQIEGATVVQEVDGDPVRLTQVFANLLNNASRFSPPGATIKLSARNLGSAVEVSIADAGAGIPPEYLERVLDLFWQVPEAEGGAPRGLGIGLSLAKTLVSLHGGSLSIQSEGLGRGATAIVSLPSVLTTVASLRSSAASVLENGVTRRRILVVDDNVDAAQSLAIVLQMDGHVTDVADSGVMALELAASNPPDLAILDIGMPEMDGLELCRRLRQTESGADMVIVALTGWGDADTRRNAQDAGFNAHFVKPLSIEDRLRLLAMQSPAQARGVALSTGAAAGPAAATWPASALRTLTVDLQSGALRADDRELH